MDDTLLIINSVAIVHDTSYHRHVTQQRHS